jgi:hypothetical protein
MSVKMTKKHLFIIENNLQKVGQSFFHLSRRTTVIHDLLVRCQVSLVPDNQTNVFSRFYSYFPLMQTIGPIFMHSSIKINIIFL